MILRFTKRSDGHHQLTVVRDDGTFSRGRMVPGFGEAAIPHDLLHAVVEQVLRLRRGVFGLVNTGLDIQELLDPERKRTFYEESDLMRSEAVTALLQAEAAWVGVENGVDRFQEAWSAHGGGDNAPNQASIDALRAARETWTQCWRALPDGETLEFPFKGE